MSLQIVIFLILVALVFDFLNGFHDAANSIATVVSTRVLRPQWAVVWAAMFNVLALGVFGAAVAKGGVGTLVPGSFLNNSADIVISPLLGLVMGVMLMLSVSWICANTT